MEWQSMQKMISKSPNPKLLEAAFEFAKEAYKEKTRFSGENYIYHAMRTALMLDKMGMDPTTIAFGILHDIVDDVPLSAKRVELKEIEKRFGSEIANLIGKISELSKVRYSITRGVRENKAFTKDKAENLRRMFLAIAGDLRVILVELISRLDGLRFLDDFPESQQKIYALETMRIFVPVANRLGLSELRRSLEDISFAHLFPKKFAWLKENLKEQYEEREKYLKHFIPKLKKIFKKERAGVVQISYRAKSHWSTYQKLATHNMDFNRIHDLLALRIITSDVASCYKVLGIIHKHFKPISGEINDYIAKPKANGYRSLHTTIYSGHGKITEIQIRTEQMHKEAEFGICAHWSYKEKIDLKKEGEKFDWVQDSSAFWKSFKLNFFPAHVFAFTPMGDVIVLPKGSTPIDFAYAVHSEIGNHCESAKIAGKIVPLNHPIENGDIVEIGVNKKRGPSKDWLNFVKTNLAKSHIKKITEEKPSGFNLPIPGFIKKKFAEISEAAKKKREEKERIKSEKPRHIYLAGQKGMLVHIAKCCKPQPGDKVRAYLTKYRSAVLHRSSCVNLKRLAEKFPEKIIDSSWE